MSSTEFLKGPQDSGKMEGSTSGTVTAVMERDSEDIALIQRSAVSLADLYRKAKKAGLIGPVSKY
jgi:hypothetical protein